MLENIAAFLLGFKREELEIWKSWKWNNSYSSMIEDIFTKKMYKKLPLEYKRKIYNILNYLKSNGGLYRSTYQILESFNTFFGNNDLLHNKNFYNYLDLLLDYPEYPLLQSYIFKTCLNCDNNDSIKYMMIEAKLCTLNRGFINYLDKFGNIILNDKLNNFNLREIIINGIINTQLSKSKLVMYISGLLEKYEDYSSVIIKLFQAPTNKYCDLVLLLLDDDEVINSGHLLEMIEMIYATPYEKLDDLEFSITHKLIYKDMSFSEACKNYYGEAMKILDEENGIKSYRRVRVPIYIRR